MSGSSKLRFLIAQWEFPADVAVSLASEGQLVPAFTELQHTHSAISNQHHGLIDGEDRAFEMLQHIGDPKTA